MRNLLLFFARYNAFFVFLLFEGAALSIYFGRNDTENKSAFLSSANEAAGSLFEQYYDMTQYWNLSAVNDSLARDNARLRSQLRSSYFYHNAKWETDSLREQQFEYIEAEVVNNSTNRPQNYLTLNRGSRHGIKPNMGVIDGTGRGLVGIVRRVSRNYATVMSVLHTDMGISAKIKRNGFFGIAQWDGSDRQRIKVVNIAKHAEVIQGDTIVTSGYSNIFPEGMMLGVVEAYTEEQGAYSLTVKLSNNLDNIRYAYVINHLMQQERKQLEEGLLDD